VALSPSVVGQELQFSGGDGSSDTLLGGFAQSQSLSSLGGDSSISHHFLESNGSTSLSHDLGFPGGFGSDSAVEGSSKLTLSPHGFPESFSGILASLRSGPSLFHCSSSTSLSFG